MTKSISLGNPRGMGAKTIPTYSSGGRRLMPGSSANPLSNPMQVMAGGKNASFEFWNENSKFLTELDKRVVEQS